MRLVGGGDDRHEVYGILRDYGIRATPSARWRLVDHLLDQGATASHVRVICSELESRLGAQGRPQAATGLIASILQGTEVTEAADDLRAARRAYELRHEPGAAIRAENMAHYQGRYRESR